MTTYNDNIGETDKFNPDNYPHMVAEIAGMLKAISHIPVYYKRDIVISYLKDHSIKNEWIAANPDLATLLVSGKVSTTHIEALFECCRWNKAFRFDLEQYLKRKLN